MREAIENGESSGEVKISTKDAFLATIKAPWNGTQAQVGAAVAEFSPTNDGEIKVTVSNKIGLNSLVYHLTEDVFGINDIPSGGGPLGDYHQTFEWYEKRRQ